MSILNPGVVYVVLLMLIINSITRYNVFGKGLINSPWLTSQPRIQIQAAVISSFHSKFRNVNGDAKAKGKGKGGSKGDSKPNQYKIHEGAREWKDCLNNKKSSKYKGDKKEDQTKAGKKKKSDKKDLHATAAGKSKSQTQRRL
jgi:hypothetical protein